MKKLAAMLLCLSMLSAGALTAYAEEEPNTDPGEATIGTVVPDSHKITITVTGSADVTVNGKEGSEFEVERLSEPIIKIKAKDGEKITKVLLNGEDITDKLVDGKLTLEPMHEDKLIEVRLETELLPVDSSKADSSDSEGSGTDSSTTDSSKADSSKTDSKTSSTAPGNTNPSTGGVIGTISVGGLAVLGALTLIKRRNKDKE